MNCESLGKNISDTVWWWDGLLMKNNMHEFLCIYYIFIEYTLPLMMDLWFCQRKKWINKIIERLVI